MFPLQNQAGHTIFPLLSSDSVFQTHDSGSAVNRVCYRPFVSTGGMKWLVVVGDGTFDIRDGAAFEVNHAADGAASPLILGSVSAVDLYDCN